MDLRQLNALAAVHDHGSFSAAARALHTVQSNVSTHVARLERELGATLVDRSSGQLTEEGLAVLDRTRRINAELEAMTADVASIGDVVSGGARIGVIGTVGRWLVPRVVEAVQREHPLVHLVILDATTTSLIPLVQSGDLDLAIVNIPSAGPDLETLPLFAEDRVLVVPTDHPLAATGHVTLAEASAHQLLMPPAGTSFRDELDSAAARAGVELTAQAEVDGMRLLASLAFQGFGPAVVPSGAVPSYVGGDWTVVAVDDLTPRSVGIVVRSKGRPSRAARAVQERIVEVVALQLGSRTGIHGLPDGPVPVAGDEESGRP